MSKELIEQLAKEYGGYRFRQHGDIGYSYQITEPDLEAFAKAYQAAAPIDNVAEALLKRVLDDVIPSARMKSQSLISNNLLDEIRALIPDTQAKKGE